MSVKIEKILKVNEKSFKENDKVQVELSGTFADEQNKIFDARITEIDPYKNHIWFDISEKLQSRKQMVSTSLIVDMYHLKNN